MTSTPEGTSVNPTQWDMELRRQAALVASDLEMLDHLLSNDLHYVHASGRQEGKREYLESLRSGAVQYLSCHAEDVKSRSISDCVELRGVFVAEVNVESVRRTLRNYFKSLWAPDQAGQLQMISWLSVPVVQK